MILVLVLKRTGFLNNPKQCLESIKQQATLILHVGGKFLNRARFYEMPAASRQK